MDDLKDTLILGGPDPRTYSAKGFQSTHVEIIADIYQYDAIYFSPDRCVMNQWLYDQYKPFHPNTPLLQAIFFSPTNIKDNMKYAISKGRKNMKRNMEQMPESSSISNMAAASCPFMNTPGTHQYIRHYDPQQLTDEKILSLWEEMVTDYIRRQLTTVSPHEVFHIPLHNITPEQEIKIVSHLKLLSMFGCLTFRGEQSDKLAPADLNYDPVLRKKISQMVMKNYISLRKEHEQQVINNINNANLSVLESTVFFDLISNDSLLEAVSEKAALEVCRHLQAVTLSEFNPAIIKTDLIPESQKALLSIY
ncbi:Uncharacterised protein [Legionella israelensis]|uniref:Uncharacterized protein n=1 Tax=Legionella israelensis TaxID=454 RepID=A0A0W0VGH7_9GAMM|nr:hypothetical protein Lisr_2102 [Legionella israelensis]STX59286.1 Uncharacterised protein [Legionella israelensis]